MRYRTLLSLAVTAALLPCASALAQTAAGYAIQTGHSIGAGASLPAIQPPTNYGDSNPHTFSIPSTATDAGPARHEKVVKDSSRKDDADDSSPTDNWVEVK